MFELSTCSYLILISNTCKFTTKSNLDFKFPQPNNHTLAENIGNEMSHKYKCNKYEFESKFISGVQIHASAKHKNEEMMNYVFNDDDDDDEEEEEQEHSDDVPTNTFKRCLYGMCNVQQMLFKTHEDLNAHLEIEHDIIEGQ